MLAWPGFFRTAAGSVAAATGWGGSKLRSPSLREQSYIASPFMQRCTAALMAERLKPAARALLLQVPRSRAPAVAISLLPGSICLLVAAKDGKVVADPNANAHSTRSVRMVPLLG